MENPPDTDALLVIGDLELARRRLARRVFALEARVHELEQLLSDAGAGAEGDPEPEASDPLVP